MKDQKQQNLKAAGRYLQSLRVKAKLSQSDVCRRLGLTKGFNLISQAECGKIRLPIKHIPGTADILGVNQKTFARRLIGYYEPKLTEALGYKLAA